MNELRISRVIDSALRLMDVDLSGVTVLTEAATGHFRVTATIAALAGAPRVMALAKDSRFGSMADARDATLALAARLGVRERIEVLTSRVDTRIGEADLVTNLGFVRPLDAAFIERLGPRAVIPLMWAPWEFRAEDLDLDECRRRHIPVVGTRETHPDLQIFRYVGMLAVKLLLDAGIEVFKSKVCLLGGGVFADEIEGALERLGAAVARLDARACRSGAGVEDSIQGADAVVVCEHRDRDPLMSANGPLGPSRIAALAPGVTLLHIAGNVDRAPFVAAGIPCFPEIFARPGYMSTGTDAVGPRPLVDLHTAGLKIGQVLVGLARSRIRGVEAERKCIQLCAYAERLPS